MKNFRAHVCLIWHKNDIPGCECCPMLFEAEAIQVIERLLQVYDPISNHLEGEAWKLISAWWAGLGGQGSLLCQVKGQASADGSSS